MTGECRGGHIRQAALHVDRGAIAADLTACRTDLHHLLGRATPERLHARGNGTARTNEQPLFHMVFGFWSSAGCCRWSASCPHCHPLEDVYRQPVLHYAHHRAQLTPTDPGVTPRAAAGV